MSRRLIVGLGEILWDLFGREKHLGGATANFAYHANALGDRGVIVSRIGSDKLGDEIREALGALRTPAEHIQTDRRLPTGTVRVRLDRAGQPTFTIATGVAWDNLRLNDKLLGLVRRADAICYGTLAQRCAVSRRTIRGCVAAATRALSVCDLNLRAGFLSLEPEDTGRMEIVTESLRMADVLKLNDDELAVLRSALGRPERGDPLARWLIREFQLHAVCVTRGARGCVLRTARKRVAAPGIRVRVADTVGSGDAFTAAMVNRMLRRRPLEEVAAFANRVGAYVASRPGGTPPLDLR